MLDAADARQVKRGKCQGLSNLRLGPRWKGAQADVTTKYPQTFDVIQDFTVLNTARGLSVWYRKRLPLILLSSRGEKA